MDVFQLDDFESAALRLRELEADFAIVAGGRFDFLHAVDLLELALGLARLGVLGAEPVHEFHHPANFPLLAFVSGEKLFFVRGALFEIIVVVAAIAQQLALPNLHDAADELVQKFAIMRDHQNRAGVIL